MDTNSPQKPESTENESHLLPKMEDLEALTSLFTPSHIIEELDKLEKLDAQEEPEPGKKDV